MADILGLNEAAIRYFNQAVAGTLPGGGGGGAVTQSGTWTVQPGNTANTTAWKVDGSAVTQPVSGTFWQATQPVSGTVTISIPTTIATGQAKVAVTNTAVQLATNTLTRGVAIKANPTNTAAITIGASSVTATADGTGNGFILKPGDAATFTVSNSNVLWINGTANDYISFEGN